MEVVQSFTIDHTHLRPGIYVSRVDKNFTTFDLRITAPNQEPAIAPAAMHTIEHLMAVWFRNSEVKENVVYVGPMGCCTGLYLIMKDYPYNVYDIKEQVLRCITWCLKQTEVPAATPQTCGNYLLHDLPMAKWHLNRYRARLTCRFNCDYVKLNVKLDNGMTFADA